MNEFITTVLRIIDVAVMFTVGIAILATMYAVIFSFISISRGRRIDPVELVVIIVLFWLVPVGLKTVPPSVLWAMVEGWQKSEEPAKILQNEVSNWVKSSLSGNDMTPQVEVSTDTLYTVDGNPVNTAVPTPEVFPTAIPLPTATPEPTQLVVDPNVDVAAKATENAAQVTRMPEATATTFYCSPDLTLADMQAGCLPPINR